MRQLFGLGSKLSAFALQNWPSLIKTMLLIFSQGNCTRWLMRGRSRAWLVPTPLGLSLLTWPRYIHPLPPWARGDALFGGLSGTGDSSVAMSAYRRVPRRLPGGGSPAFPRARDPEGHSNCNVRPWLSGGVPPIRLIEAGGARQPTGRGARSGRRGPRRRRRCRQCR